jgi:DNA polymerase
VTHQEDELPEALRRRLEFERLFGLEEVYVKTGPRAGEGEPAPKKAGGGRKKPRAEGAPPVRKRDRDDARRRAVEAARERAKAAASARRSGGAKAGRGRPEPEGRPPAEEAPREFVIEEIAGGPDEMSLFSEAERTGIPHVSAEEGSNAERLARLCDFASECDRCGLSRMRNTVVFGEGDPEAKIVFVGEAPGADEDATGRPFVGRAGKLLTKIIEAMGFKRKQVYICNVLKCRPPGNRTPAPDEVAACSPYLHEQLAVIAPRVICALGGPATKTLLGAKDGITRLRGRLFRYRGVPLMPTFHPAYLLRNMNEKGKVWEDMKKLIAFLKSLEG